MQAQRKNDLISNLLLSSRVGIGSDFDGMAEVPLGLEDVPKYPDLCVAFQRALLVYQMGIIRHRPRSLKCTGEGGPSTICNDWPAEIYCGSCEEQRRWPWICRAPVVDLYDKTSDLPARCGMSSGEL
jgi:hypothetical protein